MHPCNRNTHTCALQMHGNWFSQGPSGRFVVLDRSVSAANCSFTCVVQGSQQHSEAGVFVKFSNKMRNSAASLSLLMWKSVAVHSYYCSNQSASLEVCWTSQIWSSIPLINTNSTSVCHNHADPSVFEVKVSHLLGYKLGFLILS